MSFVSKRQSWLKGLVKIPLRHREKLTKKQVYLLANKINLAEVLSALENLAGQIGLEGGLEGWARLAERFADNED